MNKNSKIFIAGHRGMVGSAVLSKMSELGYNNIVTKTRQEVNLLDQESVESFFKHEKFDSVILCAAKVGGILANNDYKADFIYQNLQIAANIIHYSHQTGVNKLINLGSSCIYPKEADLPIKEEYLLTGALEKTNDAYAIAKIAALKMCESYYNQYGENYYSLMPCNLYGINDNFDLESSHVLPAFIRKVHEAKQEGSSSVEVWGSGKPMREFLFTEDLAKTIVFCLENIQAEDIYSQGISHLNCGSNDEVTILELMETIKKVIGYEGEIVFDSSKPDGTFRKKMDNSRLFNLGVKHSFDLESGLKKTYDWFAENH
ncbi:MAG: GDP-L-fucose synthase [Crocinitomicaceae bacterium]|nr:GDP-L-fucose synthase [Crocinitomicaceae bacterium]